MTTHGKSQILASVLLAPTHDEITENIQLGDKLQYKTKNTIRLDFLNINTFPSNKSQVNIQLLRDLVTSAKIDILGLSELNCGWPRISPEDRIGEVSRNIWKRVTTIHSHNQINCDQRFQPGGTALLMFEQVSDRIISNGGDPRLLGRWSWTRTRGRNGITAPIVSAYRPVVSKGPSSTYVQNVLEN